MHSNTQFGIILSLFHAATNIPAASQQETVYIRDRVHYIRGVISSSNLTAVMLRLQYPG